MAKKFAYRGKTIEEISSISIEDFSKLVSSRERRRLKHGLLKREKMLLQKIAHSRGKDKLIRTHARDMIIFPEMIGAKLGIYNGKEYVTIIINEYMIGHRIGEFALTRKRVKHSSPGFGATRSSKFVPLK
ncbi:MAG: 30S ribosomal protein S19 [Candidatus Aenigmatarchaeota archaeon]